jgi:hypothetical protein
MSVYERGVQTLISVVRIERDDDEWTLWDDDTPAWAN